MKTLHLAVDSGRLDSAEAKDAIALAAELLRSGGTVALPTETVYGLGANALDEAAVAKIFAAKQRPAWDPIIVHVCDQAMLGAVVAEIPEPPRARIRALIAAFWPGPLTLLLPRSAAIPDSVTAGRPLVGVRMPEHPVALALIRRAGVPVAAPSANVFGHISPTTAAHVLADLDGRIDAVLDAGPTAHGVESTVLDPNQSPMMIYRPGAITEEQIRAVAGPVEIYRSARPLADTPAEALPSPGVGLRHYAPRARLILVDVGANMQISALSRRLAETAQSLSGERVGVLLPREMDSSHFDAPVTIHPWGRWAAPDQMARELYAGLRQLDDEGCTAIVCPLPPADGIGAAIRDRLVKAAS